MNWFFYLLLILAAVLVWFLFSFGYRPIGKLFYRIYKDAKDAIVKDDNTEKINETKEE